MLINGRLNSTYVKEHLDCLTFLYEQFVKQDKNDLRFLIDNLRMAVENCQNMMKLVVVLMIT